MSSRRRFLDLDCRVEREPYDVWGDAEHPETIAEEDLVVLLRIVKGEPEPAMALDEAEGLFARRFTGGPDKGQRSLSYFQNHSSLTFVMRRRPTTREGYRPVYKSSVRSTELSGKAARRSCAAACLLSDPLSPGR